MFTLPLLTAQCPHKCSKHKWIIGVLKMITQHKENIKHDKCFILLLLLITMELIKHIHYCAEQ